MNLVSPAEVYDLTSATVGAEDISVAQAIIESACGRTLDGGTIYAPRDARLLRNAVAFQAAYLQANTDVLTVKPYTSASANGVSITYGAGGSADTIIAPLAHMNLAKLSWRRSRSIEVVVDRAETYGTVDIVADESIGWSPL